MHAVRAPHTVFFFAFFSASPRLARARARWFRSTIREDTSYVWRLTKLDNRKLLLIYYFIASKWYDHTTTLLLSPLQNETRSLIFLVEKSMLVSYVWLILDFFLDFKYCFARSIFFLMLPWGESRPHNICSRCYVLDNDDLYTQLPNDIVQAVRLPFIGIMV
jgi:hypothetical protein